MKKRILALACCTMLLSISSVVYSAEGTNGLAEQGQYFSKGDTELSLISIIDGRRFMIYEGS